MRYDDPKLIDALAREYVVGTLRGRARARFARLHAGSLAIRRAVAGWEQMLAPLAAAVRPAEPPRATWSQIEAVLGRGRRPTFGVGVWQALAAGLAAAAIVIGSLYLTRPPESASYVAVISDAQAGPIWLLQGYEERGELRVATIMDRPVPAGSDYELWMLPGGGANPVSLGLISGVADTLLALTPAALQVLAQTMTLAISLEPAGGSPSGQPTGPVIFTAPLLRG
jgi:anti-sigma-K factor RskA